ncbi:MAG: SDR family oxidoreductase [Rhodospirillaceae bacterium]|jgi:NAD(P)-dependent dehydrogenase (short-subunit alcohol dehydrogenase family)|nr:SDR family oxidoreductase [Rhodospirillaceae bacterium]MBT5896490.1 SDR family oxidoreductase [Rhodospirillaceae bacterium]MBT6426636.1 SDR family oxidoreductase [Rhodospirillaceae bacterium]MBT7756658.1 SDR family oxidoreductase [Rhodospirillaceae bacterium]
MGRLDGKVAVITGAGSGIARAAARIFTREGAQVVVAEIDPELGAASALEAGNNAIFVPTDVTDEDSVQSLMNQAVEQFGGLHILFNCAGGSVLEDRKVTDVDMAVWERTIPLDLKGPFLCSRHGIPKIIESGGGTVINVSSVVALRGNHPAHVYSAAKGGLISFTRSLAGSYSDEGVRANVICPGLVKTDRVKSRYVARKPSEERKGTVGTFESYPFGVGEPEDIANIALFLASDESRMVNGAVIPAEGGISAY